MHRPSGLRHASVNIESNSSLGCATLRPRAIFAHLRVPASLFKLSIFSDNIDWPDCDPWRPEYWNPAHWQFEPAIFPEVTSLNSTRFISRPFGSFIALVAVFIFPSDVARATRPPEQEFRLRLYETHTNERIDIVYRKGDVYLSGAIDRLELFLRDHRTGDLHHFDPQLFDLLRDLTYAVGRPDAEIDIVCGYRTPRTNEFLRRTTTGVSPHSLHMEGRAIDIRIPGVTTTALRDAALGLHRGGVGYYARSQFVHVDDGRVRQWTD